MREWRPESLAFRTSSNTTSRRWFLASGTAVNAGSPV